MPDSADRDANFVFLARLPALVVFFSLSLHFVIWLLVLHG